MEGLGQLIGITKNWETGKLQLTFELEQDVSRQLDDIKDRLLSIVVKMYRKKRSLDANAYYWQLVGKLADKLQVSRPYIHNQMLRRYGELEELDGKQVYVVLPDSEDGARLADEAETFHIKPTSEIKTGADGMTYRTYKMLRGSHTYDTKEMSVLINGLIGECREQDIEILTPDQVAEMIAAYDRNWRKKHEVMECFNG